MLVAILTIGTEVTTGHVVNTNAAWLGSELTKRGHEPVLVLSVGDTPASIRSALGAARRAAPLTICTGGLGPTHDDITRTVLARSFRVRLAVDRQLLSRVAARFAERGIPMAASNRTQALVPPPPHGFLPNDDGTAPGLIFRKGRTTVIALPGVPFEMRRMFSAGVVPLLPLLPLLPALTVSGVQPSGNLPLLNS